MCTCQANDIHMPNIKWYVSNMQFLMCISAHTHNGILLSQKKNAGMPLAATWMDLEIIILSEVRKRQISYDITFVESKKMI